MQIIVTAEERNRISAITGQHSCGGYAPVYQLARVLNYCDSARVGLVHRPYEIVVEFGIVKAGEIERQRFDKQLLMHTKLELAPY